MSSTSTTNSLALHEIILSIADSLNEAQETLRSMPPYDEYGRPNTLYQLPYLDFNLEVISQFETTQTNENSIIAHGVGVGVGAVVPRLPAAPVIRFSPFRSTETTSKNLGSITSTISGRFVAVMPNEGLPQLFLECTAQKLELDPNLIEYRITVRALNATNQAIVNQRIEINFDEFTSLGFNSETPVTAPVFTSAKDGYTNNEGIFSVLIQLDSADYDTDKTFVFKANSGTQFSSISISKP